MTDSRSTYRYRKARATWLLTAGDVCWCCGLRVRYDVGPRHTLAPTVDHMSEVDRGEVDPMDMRHWRLAHFGCNSTRGNHYREARDAKQLDTPVRTSRPI
jgi:hypothetical protein